MTFALGLIIGLVIGACFGFIISAIVGSGASPDDDRDYRP